MMAVSPSSFFSFLLVVAHLMILNFAAAPEKYQPNCPEFFNSCENTTTGKIGFPFTNNTHPGCGLCTVNCSPEGPTIQLVRGGEWYPFKEIREEVIIIPNNNLRKLRISRSCDLFIDPPPIMVFPPATPSISFEPLTPYATLLKCSSSGDELDQQIANYLPPFNYSSYQGCNPGFTVYYRYPPPATTNEIPPTPPPTTTNEIPPTPPNGRNAIQRPILPSRKNTNAGDIFLIPLDEELIK